MLKSFLTKVTLHRNKTFAKNLVVIVSKHIVYKNQKKFATLLLNRFKSNCPNVSNSELLEKSQHIDIDHCFAEATIDTAFKHLLSPNLNRDKSVIISFLNSFIPVFKGDSIVDIDEMPVALPVLREKREKQTFMDLHVVSDSGARYIIEMQALRHAMFDERALYYASSTYSRQLSEKQQSETYWYYNLKPVIALQILDYDSNKIRGIHAIPEGVEETLFERVQAAPMDEKQFIKHFLLTDKYSKQVIDYLQIIQIELPRADRIKMLSPPHKDFTEQEWWLSIFIHANDYTVETVENMHSRCIMPEVIYRALMRLDKRKWSPRMIREYESKIIDRQKYATMFAVERVEGEKEGEKIGEEKMILSMFDNQITVEQIAVIAQMSTQDVTTIIESRNKQNNVVKENKEI